jgi:hypothetical protein
MAPSTRGRDRVLAESLTISYEGSDVRSTDGSIFVTYCIRRHSEFCLSVGCQHFLSHSEVSLHYLVLPFSAVGPATQQTTSSAVPRRVFTFSYRRVPTGKHSALVGLVTETLAGVARAAPGSRKSARNMYQMQTFPSGIYRENFHSPQSLADYRSSFSWIPGSATYGSA